MLNQRILILKEELKKLKLDGMIVTDKTNIYYLTNISMDGILILKNKEQIFLTYEKYYEYIESTLSLEQGISLKTIEKNLGELVEIFFENENIAIESHSITVAELNSFKNIFKTNFIETEHLIEKIRAVKEKEEIEKISEISEALSEIMKKIKSYIKIGVSENFLISKIYELFKEYNLEKTDCIRVSTGENTANPYYKSGKRKIEAGDTVIIDIRGKKDCYYAEIGRTFFVSTISLNNINKNLKKDESQEIKYKYENLLKVYDRSLRTIKNHNIPNDIFEDISNNLENIHWQLKYYVARGIGLSDNEYPKIESGQYDKIRENMIVVIEPQIYLKGHFGILHKDTVLVTSNNFLILTKD